MKLRPIGKKADLSLSINAIVILILAITVLSLGLTFIRGMFKAGTGKIEQAISLAELESQPTIEKPIAIPGTIELNSGSSTTLKIGVYNPHPGDTFKSAKPVIADAACVLSGSDTVPTKPFTLTATTQDIAARSSAAYQTVLKHNSGTANPTGTYVCTVTAIGYDSAGTALTSADPRSAISTQVFIMVK